MLLRASHTLTAGLGYTDTEKKTLKMTLIFLDRYSGFLTIYTLRVQKKRKRLPSITNRGNLGVL
jgi:hypothetical protein